MTTGTSLKDARKKHKDLLRTISFNEDMKHIKPLKEDRPNYTWKDLIVWNPKEKIGFRVKEGAPTLLSVVAIFLFMFMTQYIPVTSQAVQSLFAVILMFTLVAPVMVEWLAGVFLINRFADKILVRITIHHAEWNRTFQIEDIVKNWYPRTRHPITKASANTNRGCIELELANKWHIGNNKTATHHIFDSITIWGNSRFLQSLDSLAHFQSIETDILGVPIKIGAYVFSLKVEEKEGWCEDIYQYVAMSWATKETALFKPVYTYITKTEEPKIKECPYCANPLTDNELILTNHWVANQYKERMAQASSKASHEEALKDQTLSSDLMMNAIDQKIRKFYRKGILEQIGFPKLTKKQWLIVALIGIVLLALASETFQNSLRSIWAAIAGGATPPAETPIVTTTTPPITTSGGV